MTNGKFDGRIVCNPWFAPEDFSYNVMENEVVVKRDRRDMMTKEARDAAHSNANS